MGVHDSSEVVWSYAPTTGTVPIHQTFKSDDDSSHTKGCNERPELEIEAKIPNIFSIGSMVSTICCSILLDKRDIFPVSHLQPEFGCCFSWPVKLGRRGAVGEIEVPIDDGEKTKLAQMATTLKTMINHIPL
jgi:L-lactate dehydrogenase